MSIQKKIDDLSKILLQIGNKKEAILIGSLKIATPLEGYFPINKKEPFRMMPDPYEEDEENEDDINKDEKENEIEKKVDRPVGILRNIPGGRNHENPIDDEDNWYDSIKMLKNKIILIPVDVSDIKSNPGLMESLAQIWGMEYDKKFLQKIGLFDNFSDEKLGDRQVLKNNFPSLWSDISNLLNNKGISENEAIYMFYNQESVGMERLNLFARDPHYFAHDLGHIDFDFSEDMVSEFKEHVESFVSNVLKLYKTNKEDDMDDEDTEDNVENDIGDENILDDEDASDNSALNAINDDSDLLTYNAGHFFGPIRYSSLEQNDVLGDIFAAVMNDKIQTYIPDSIGLHGVSGNEDYFIKEEDIPKAQEMVESCLAKLKRYVYGNEDKTIRSGPFYFMEGYVVWY